MMINVEANFLFLFQLLKDILYLHKGAYFSLLRLHFFIFLELLDMSQTIYNEKIIHYLFKDFLQSNLLLFPHPQKNNLFKVK